MSSIRSRWSAWPLVCGVAMFLCSNPAWACSVCFGNPDSPMAKGVTAGVLLLVGVIGFVLLGVAGTGLLWVQRSRRLALNDDGESR